MPSLNLAHRINLKLRDCIFIFVIALIFRISIISFYNTDTIPIDGTGYHRIAYNITEGQGYCLHQGEKYFFREPGYPIFLSFSFKISKLFGNNTENLSFDSNYKILNNAPEIKIAKYMQAILDSFACVLFFLLIGVILNRKFAFLIAIIFSLYFQYAYNVTFILRETLQSFLTIAMCYSLLRYFKTNKTKYLISTGIIWGLINLTFQASLIFAVSIPIFILIYKKSFIKAIIPSMIVILMMILTISPWLIRTYNSYPDTRILKSFGTSLTPEYRSYYSAVIAGHYYGLISKEKLDSITINDFANISEVQKFRFSWDGTFNRKRDSINALVCEPIISNRKIIATANKLKNCAPPTFSKNLINESPTSAGLLILPVAMICIFSILGAIMFFRKFFTLNITLVTYLAIFMLIADEKRRMLPIQPFILLYGMMGIFYFYYKYYKRYDNKTIIDVFFIS
jgi:hypothetical protein